jgi:hypothetical protein
MPTFRQTTLAIAFAAACTGPVPGEWFHGTTHTHTLNSDGDSTPDNVAGGIGSMATISFSLPITP